MRNALILPAAAFIVTGSIYAAEPLSAERYVFAPLIIILAAIFAATSALAAKGKMTALSHMRLWNSVLLISFLMTALIGTLLIIRLNYGMTSGLLYRPLYWHVEAGVVMTMATVFHMVFYWRYFWAMLRRSKKP